MQMDCNLLIPPVGDSSPVAPLGYASALGPSPTIPAQAPLQLPSQTGPSAAVPSPLVPSSPPSSMVSGHLSSGVGGRVSEETLGERYADLSQ